MNTITAVDEQYHWSAVEVINCPSFRFNRCGQERFLPGFFKGSLKVPFYRNRGRGQFAIILIYNYKN